MSDVIEILSPATPEVVEVIQQGPQGSTINDANAPATNNILWQIRTSAFTAASGGRYVANGTFTVTNPASGNNGEMFQVVVASGTVTVNGVAYGASRWPVTVARVAGAWTTLANTLTENLTLNGTNSTAPSQQASSDSSLMTRSLVDNEFFRRVNKYSEHEIYTFTTAMLTTIGGSASPIIVTGAADAPAWSYRPTNSVASANNYQALIGVYLQLSNGANRSIKNWSKRSALSIRHLHLSSAGTTRYYWGPQASNWVGGALAVRGIGFEIVNNSVFATCHNGTTKTTAASGVALSNQIFYGLHIESDGAGGVRWWVDGAEQTALTGGPTGNSGNNQYGFCTEAVNPDPAVGTFVNIHYLRLATVN